MKIVRFIRVTLAILLIYWAGMGGLLASHAYKKGWILADFDSIEAKSAIEMMQNHPEMLVLDVRTKEEFEETHLENALNIPVQILEKSMDKLNNYKQQKILVYCRSGNRSVKASRILEKNAFIPLNVKGGMHQLKRYDAPHVN
jgi:rhodanese-related sulfurtransferase